MSAKLQYESAINTTKGIGVQISSLGSLITNVYPLASSKNQKILIRGIPLVGDGDVIVQRSYEEALFILFNGKIPNKNELDKISKEIQLGLMEDHALSDMLFNIEPLIEKPLIFLQILILSFAYREKNTAYSIIAKSFAVIANLFNTYVGRNMVKPSIDLGLIENFLYMIGKDYTNKTLVKCFTRIMIAWIEIGPAPSAIATRVNASSRADTISALTAGVGNATGWKHTSARVAAMKLLIEIRTILLNNNINIFAINENGKKLISTKLQEIIASGNVIPGFGHYIFKGFTDDTIDPRIYLVEQAINEFYPQNEMLAIVNAMRSTLKQGITVKNGINFRLPPNSDIYWSAFLHSFLKEYGKPEDMYPVASLFTILSRISGLVAHDAEQRKEQSSMKIWGWISG